MVSIAFVLVALRLMYLHIWNGEALQAVAEKNRYTFRTLYARRGNIQDSQGNLLATTRPVITLGLDPQVLREQDKKNFPTLAKLARIPLSAIEAAAALQIKAPKTSHQRLVRWKKLAEGLTDADYEAILALKIKGVYGNRSFERIYPAGKQGAHVLGFINKEGLAIGGVEQYLDFYLRGQDGWIETESDGKRQELAQYREREVPSCAGCNAELYLDLHVQHLIEKKIDAIAQQYNPLSINIIVSEAAGPILGLANYPSYDPNHFSNYPLDTHRNRAITDVYEPGSAFKIVVSSAALQEKVVQLEDTFDCAKPTLFYKGKELKLPKNYRTMGTLSVADIVVCSSNRGMVHLAVRLGEEKFYDYIQRFGFGELTGYDGLGEVRGLVRKVKDWDSLTITRLPMGHALSVTPLQMHCAMGVIVNNGLLMKPLLIKAIRDPQGHVLAAWKPKVKRRVISSEVASTLTKLLERVTRNTKVRGVPIAYKTGTTQKIIHGKYSNTQHISSSSGFIQGKNKTLLLTIVIDTPQVRGTAYGALVAAPCFKELAEELVYQLNLEAP